MNFWIKSQNGQVFKSIFDLGDIEICKFNANFYVICSSKRYILGIYKTKERANEVFNEIDELIKKSFNKDIAMIKYVMPKE